MTIESFWMAFKRFIATRGRCSTVFSDNAKTFVSVSKDLEKAWGDVKALQEKEESRNYLAMNKIKWKFIAERAPWWGGKGGVVFSSSVAALGAPKRPNKYFPHF